MAKKKVSKIDKLEQILESALNSEWCTVDTENCFNFMNNKMIISDSVDQYKVLSKPKMNEEKGTWNNWANEAQMDKILVIDDGEEFRFFDQSFDEINVSKVNYV